MNFFRDWTSLPYVEPSPKNGWPCTRDDGVKSYREYAPLKSLQLPKPEQMRLVK